MKKGVIALLLVLVLVIIVSPGIVGKLAEQKVEENLTWAADESGELTVISEGFERGWFSSAGRHRITLSDGGLRSALDGLTGGGGEPPSIVIDTHLDHGLIPVSSMGREQGSLAPGLGNAVSTLTVDYGNGETFPIPGKVFSKVGLGGGLESNFVLEAGSHDTDDGTVTWELSNLAFSADPNSGDFRFDGEVGSLNFTDGLKGLSVDGLTLSGDQQQTEYGFAVGDIELHVGNVTLDSGSAPSGGLRGLTVIASSQVAGGLASSETFFELEGQTIPGFGEISVTADVRFSDADAVALGAISTRLKEMNGATDPGRIMMAAQEEFMALLAGGFRLDFEQLDVTLPMGTVEAIIDLTIPKSDAATFDWASLLLTTVASVDLKVPEALVDLATQMNPQTGMIVGMGYLKKDGDVYEMKADYKQGLLTINGAPVPIPLGAFQ